MNLWYNDDVLQRIYILCNTAILIVYGNNAPFVDRDILYMRLSVTVYLIVHANITIISLFYSLSSHRYRKQMRLWATLVAISHLSGFPYFQTIYQLAQRLHWQSPGLLLRTVPGPSALLRCLQNCLVATMRWQYIPFMSRSVTHLYTSWGLHNSFQAHCRFPCYRHQFPSSPRNMDFDHCVWFELDICESRGCFTT